MNIIFGDITKDFSEYFLPGSGVTESEFKAAVSKNSYVLPQTQYTVQLTSQALYCVFVHREVCPNLYLHGMHPLHILYKLLTNKLDILPSNQSQSLIRHSPRIHARPVRSTSQQTGRNLRRQRHKHHNRSIQHPAREHVRPPGHPLPIHRHPRGSIRNRLQILVGINSRRQLCDALHGTVPDGRSSDAN